MLERTLLLLGIVGLIASLAHSVSPAREAIGCAYALQSLRWHWRRPRLAPVSRQVRAAGSIRAAV